MRFSVGTVAQIVEAASFPTVGSRSARSESQRIRVVSWLDDDPYPRAEVEMWADPPAKDALSACTSRTW